MPVQAGGYEELPNIGTMSYNGVEFDPLWTSTVSASQILDEANRVVKYVQYTFTIDGYVTLVGGETTTDASFVKIRRLLQQQGGTLTYSGKGFGKPFVVNAPGGTLKDLAYGPIPKLLDFQPLGGSAAAKVRWQVTTCISEVQAKSFFSVLQFNWENSVNYDMDGYSSLSFSGTLEAPITPATPKGKEITLTVDNYRTYVDRVANGIDLTRFKITSRDINISRDKRTLTFSIKAEELGPMANPAGVYTAKGNFSCRSANKNGGANSLTQWICTLRCTYVVPKGRPQRLAWRAFVTLLAERMYASQNPENMPQNQNGNPLDPAPQPSPLTQVVQWSTWFNAAFNSSGVSAIQTSPQPAQNQIKTFVTSFDFEEGLYEDSRTVSFTCSWVLYIPFRWVLRATGWRQFQANGDPSSRGLCNPNLWAQSIRNISGSNSWLFNRLDPAACAVVDLGT